MESYKMVLLQLIIWYVNLATALIEENSSINCPRFCICDSYQQLNRAQCSSRNLISAELDLPNQVQILDLSYNDITTVDNKCFVSFLHLKYLNLTHNAVHSIDWDTFFKLRRLIEIDLSHNRLEYLDERLFIKNKYLDKVNLADNKFHTLENKPILRNPFVSVIILQNSQINSLQPQLFAGLSNLKYLDLSQNLLNSFETEDFQLLTKLKHLNLNDNFMECNKDIKYKIQQMQNKGINVSLRGCESEIERSSQQQQHKFEKLVTSEKIKQEEGGDRNQSNKIKPWRFNLDSEEELIDDDGGAEEAISANYKNNNEWLRFAPDAVLCEPKNIVLCQEYRSCLQDLSKAWHNQREYREQCSAHDIQFAFLMGIAIGVAAIVFILACALCLKRCLEVKKSAAIVIEMDDAHNLPNQPLARPTTQLPPQVRRQPRRRSARPARSLVRYEGPVAENFLSRLFGRPARQQYYRSINQNTATLIRRLSRSNLFNNRLSQHFIERQSSAEANSPEIQDFPATAPRPETPPPSYGDIVVKNVNEGN